MGARATRVALYGIIIGLAICINIAAGLTEFDLVTDTEIFTRFGAPSPFGSGVRFGIVACVVAFLTWVWTSVLMAWNDKPYSESGLALSLTHFISFIVMSIIWLAIAIMHFVETTVPCQASSALDNPWFDSDYLAYIFSAWCAEASVVGALSLAISILSGATALFILVSSRKIGGLQTKLVAHDGEINLREMKHATRVRTALYCLVLVFGLAINVMTPFSIIVTIVSSEEGFLVTNGADTAFAAIALICSLFTWIWASVLLAYHRRISPKNPMTRASAHCISTMVLGTVWFVLGVIILGFAGSNCTIETDSGFPGYCYFILPVGVLSLCLSVLLDSVSLFIRVQIRRGGGSIYKSHVAQFDGGRPALEVQPQVPPLGYHYGHQCVPIPKPLPVSDSYASVQPPCHACHHCCHQCHGHGAANAHAHAHAQA